MLGKRLAMIAAIAAFLPAQLAMAQTQASVQSSGLIGLNLASNTIAAASLEEAQARRGGGGSASRGYTPKVFAGLWLGDDSQGFAVGGGISANPFMDERHELQGNVEYLHVEGSNGFGIDADYYFNFKDVKLGSFTPFAGAGLIITHFGGDCATIPGFGEICGGGGTDTHLQIGGGIKKALNGGKGVAVRGQIILSDYSAFLLTLEYLLGRR